MQAKRTVADVTPRRSHRRLWEYFRLIDKFTVLRVVGFCCPLSLSTRAVLIVNASHAIIGSIDNEKFLQQGGTFNAVICSDIGTAFARGFYKMIDICSPFLSRCNILPPPVCPANRH